jgi:hypothetical protein
LDSFLKFRPLNFYLLSRFAGRFLGFFENFLIKIAKIVEQNEKRAVVVSVYLLS